MAAAVAAAVAAAGVGAAGEAPLAGVVGGRRRVVLAGVGSRTAGERTPRERPQQVERRDSRVSNDKSEPPKFDTKSETPKFDQNEGSQHEEDEEDRAQTAAKDMQAKRLYAALTYNSDHEREAYRRNRTEQTRLEMALEHIGMQRAVASKTMQREVNVMKVRSTRIDERARLTADGARTPRGRPASTHPIGQPSGNTSKPSRSVSTFQGYYSNHPEDEDTLELPNIGGTLRRTGRPGARSITFISETVYQHAPSGNPINGPQKSMLGPSTSARSNVAGYIDTSALRKPAKVVPASANNPRLRLGRQQTGDQNLSTQTKSAYQPLSRLRSSLHLQQKQQPTGGKHKPLMAILANSLSSSSRLRSSKAVLDASKSLDADIDAVINARFDTGDEGEKKFTLMTRSQGFGLRQPANFSSNYKPLEDTPRDSLDENIDTDTIGEEGPDADGEDVRETLRSFTSLSQRPGIDRIATPSSNALRGEGRGIAHPKAFSARSASIGASRDLHNQRRRGQAQVPPLRQGFSIHGALLREKTQMKKFEDKLDSFYEKLKGSSAKAGKTTKQNHWDMRGLDEKLLLY